MEITYITNDIAPRAVTSALIGVTNRSEEPVLIVRHPEGGTVNVYPWQVSRLESADPADTWNHATHRIEWAAQEEGAVLWCESCSTTLAYLDDDLNVTDDQW